MTTAQSYKDVSPSYSFGDVPRTHVTEKDNRGTSPKRDATDVPKAVLSHQERPQQIGEPMIQQLLGNKNERVEEVQFRIHTNTEPEPAVQSVPMQRALGHRTVVETLDVCTENTPLLRQRLLRVVENAPHLRRGHRPFRHQGGGD